MTNLLTVLIPSYKSRRRIYYHVKNISKNIKIIIIENSQDKVLKKELEKKNKNVKVYLQDNIGYGRAINYGAKFVKTKFFFVIKKMLLFVFWKHFPDLFCNFLIFLDCFWIMGARRAPIIQNQPKKSRKMRKKDLEIIFTRQKVAFFFAEKYV